MGYLPVKATSFENGRKGPPTLAAYTKVTASQEASAGKMAVTTGATAPA